MLRARSMISVPLSGSVTGGGTTPAWGSDLQFGGT